MGWFTSTETYTREIWSEAAPVEAKDGKPAVPGKGEKCEVKFRRLNAGDAAAIQDTLRMEMGEGEEAKSSLALGTMRLLSVERAVVDWNIPNSKPTPEAIRALTPDVFAQIYEHIDLGDESPTSEKPVAEPAKQDELPTLVGVNS